MVLYRYSHGWPNKKAVDFYSRRGAENAEVSIICRSDFSRELSIFATKAVPTNICKLSAVSASARVFVTAHSRCSELLIALVWCVCCVILPSSI